MRCLVGYNGEVLRDIIYLEHYQKVLPDIALNTMIKNKTLMIINL